MDKKTQFYGTPLAKLLGHDRRDDQESSSSARRARIYQQQTVRDSQGRQRFHGAFTGGFSAGYFNTVDSVKGFQPKQFVSQRNTKRDTNPAFLHRPEDYMDDEDLSEFGIAPMKIRVKADFADHRRSDQNTSLIKSIVPQSLSIGEKILLRLIGRQSFERFKRCEAPFIAQNHDWTSQGYHGIGYTPLQAPCRGFNEESTHYQQRNPLIATTVHGKRIKISGEAFGTGVLEEDDDLHLEDTYGVDDLSNYDFMPQVRSAKTKEESNLKSKAQPDCLVPGFKLCEYLSRLELGASSSYEFPCPQVPDNWLIPSRTVVQSRNFSTIEGADALVKKAPLGLATRMFTSSSKLLSSDGIESQTGLVKYADLKATKPIIREDLESQPDNAKASIDRKISTWQPCSLLCKRFNVQVPTRLDLTDSSTHVDTQTESIQISLIRDKIAPIELRRDIFNVRLDDTRLGQKDSLSSSSSSYEDDKPQLVELVDEQSNLYEVKESCGPESDEEDVVILDTCVKKEPEIIEISNSSDSSSAESQMVRKSSQKQASESESSDSEYGPPLPPTLETLISLDRRHKSTPNHKSSRGRSQS